MNDRRRPLTDQTAESTRSKASPTRNRVSRFVRRRRLVWILVALQILIPLMLLVARWQDPSIGVQPFGWQVHTNCWGSDEC